MITIEDKRSRLLLKNVKRQMSITEIQFYLLEIEVQICFQEAQTGKLIYLNKKCIQQQFQRNSKLVPL